MKKITIKLLLACCFTLIASLTMMNSDNFKTQKLSLQNLIVLNSAMAEGGGGSTKVDCNSCWAACFFGCTTKYRCNVVTPCYKIMAKSPCSNGEKSDCLYSGN